MIIGLTSGCFDLLHFGHLRYLESCKALCDTLLVGVDSDLMVQAVKGPERPFIPEFERLKMIQAQRCVDAAFLLHNLYDLRQIAVQFQVDKVFKHAGFKEIKHVVGVEGTKAELVIVPDVAGLVSTTDLVERIRTRKQPERMSPKDCHDEGDYVRVLADGVWVDAVLALRAPFMHECGPGVRACIHRIWVAEWPVKSGCVRVQPIGKDWSQVEPHRSPPVNVDCE